MAAARKRILIVEDDADLRSEIARVIAALGAEPVEAGDGVEALARLASGPPPSAILLDMWMPRLDGVGFLDAMKRVPAWAEIPVVTMTGGPDPVTDAVVASRLHKPFDVEELVQLVLSLCAPHAEETAVAAAPARAARAR